MRKVRPKPQTGVTWACSLALAMVLSSGVGGCDTKASMTTKIADRAPTAGRAATRDDLRELVARGITTLEDLMNEANTRFEAGEDMSHFGGAVLDLYIEKGPELPKGQEYELFWRRVGQLAYVSAYRAFEQGRGAEALELSTAGPSRWQNGSYWRTYPNHDALVSILIAINGDKARALSRISSREIESPELAEAREAIRQMGR